VAGEALSEEPLGDVGDGELLHGVPLSDPSGVGPLPFRHVYYNTCQAICQEGSGIVHRILIRARSRHKSLTNI